MDQIDLEPELDSKILDAWSRSWNLSSCSTALLGTFSELRKLVDIAAKDAKSHNGNTAFIQS